MGFGLHVFSLVGKSGENGVVVVLHHVRLGNYGNEMVADCISVLQ
jgi:hypothetical protein